MSVSVSLGALSFWVRSEGYDLRTGKYHYTLYVLNICVRVLWIFGVWNRMIITLYHHNLRGCTMYSFRIRIRRGYYTFSLLLQTIDCRSYHKCYNKPQVSRLVKNNVLLMFITTYYNRDSADVTLGKCLYFTLDIEHHLANFNHADAICNV